MRTNLQAKRYIETRLGHQETRRIVVLTGARQTGKTTLAQSLFRDLRYVNLDAIEDRTALRAIHTAAWDQAVGAAVLDEAQKEPSIFEKVKWAFDAGRIDLTVLLGSSRFLLLDNVKETLAGRAFIYDLWPLMACELRSIGAEACPAPLLDALLASPGGLSPILDQQPEVLLGDEEATRRAATDHLALWGGMPGLLPLSDDDRREWLRSYQQTFLERDLTDLVRLRDLQPFRTLQQLAMLRTGGLLSYSELARDAGIAVATVRRYLEYLRLSYQVVLLRPWRANLTSTVVKSPKLYWTDLGLLRQTTMQWGPTTGPLFETLVVTEIHKWISTAARTAEPFFYRTRSGMEVDLLIRTEHGVIAMEIKQRGSSRPSDTRPLRALAAHLGSAWRGGIVVTGGTHLRRLDADSDIWEIPIHRLL
jgi:predicted AAA+ superfamily ATPase